MATSSQPSKQQSVISHFFARPSQSSTVIGGSGLRKQPSIISLSDSDQEDTDGAENELQVVGSKNLTSVPKKRKPLPDVTADRTVEKDKKAKVAPLFDRAKTAQVCIETVKTEAGEAARKLQKWKSTNSATTAIPLAAELSSSPQKPKGYHTNKRNDKVLQARRAEVRRKLLGVSTSYRRSSSEEEEDQFVHKEDAKDVIQDSSEGENSESIPRGAQWSLSTKANIGSKSSKIPVKSATSRFAKFAATAECSTATKGRKSSNGKAKELANDPKYTPLEQQVLAIKAQNVS